MAVKIGTFGIGDVSLNNVMKAVNLNQVRHDRASLLPVSASRPLVAAGSIIESNGAVFEVLSNETINGTTPDNGTYYVKCPVVGNTMTFELTQDYPTWSHTKQGFYVADDKVLDYQISLLGGAYIIRDVEFYDIVETFGKYSGTGQVMPDNFTTAYTSMNTVVQQGAYSTISHTTNTGLFDSCSFLLVWTGGGTLSYGGSTGTSPLSGSIFSNPAGIGRTFGQGSATITVTNFELTYKYRVIR